MNDRTSLIYFITSFLWLGLALIYWGNIVKKFQLKNNWIVLLTILLVNLCLAYMLYKLPLKPTTIMSYQFIIFQTYTNIVSFIIFNFALGALICADNIGIRLLAAGFISMIGANFLTSYIVYTYNPSAMIYRNDFWLFSSCILISGLFFLKDHRNTTITFFTNERSIKNIIVGWTLSIVVLTASLFLGLASYFNVLTTPMLSILPYIMFIYIILAVFMALAISYIFEVPIREINSTIRHFIEHSMVEKSKNRINVAEFMVLNDFLLYTIGIIDERNNFQEKFRKSVGQVIHDIQSPLSSLSTIVEEQSSNLPENTRITLRNATNRISDIANNMFSKYENKDITKNENMLLLVSLALLQVMSEKRYEYNKTNLTFDINIEQKANFAFIKIDSSDFKRMISNIINNAVEALRDKPDGKVEIELCIAQDKAVIFIRDNGNGMPQHIINKFYEGLAVTEGKKNGHGIGLTQVREVVATYSGKCKINVIENEGTEIILRFPHTPNSYWIAPEIKLTKDDTVIILDDDNSIHGAWENKFKSILEAFPSLQVKYFIYGKDVIDYIHSLNNEQKENVFLLTDYELLNQNMNGLDVVRDTGIKRAILVTSHASSHKIQEMVFQAGIKALPKELTYAVSIFVDKRIAKWSRKVDMVWVQDQKIFVDDMVREFYSHIKVDVYYEPDGFITDVNQYPLDTRFILDTNYYTKDGTAYILDGFSLAKKLHDLGYTKIILFAGEAVKATKIPPYLTVILKNDLIKRKNLDKI